MAPLNRLNKNAELKKANMPLEKITKMEKANDKFLKKANNETIRNLAASTSDWTLLGEPSLLKNSDAGAKQERQRGKFHSEMQIYADSN